MSVAQQYWARNLLKHRAHQVKREHLNKAKTKRIAHETILAQKKACQLAKSVGINIHNLSSTITLKKAMISAVKRCTSQARKPG